MRSSESLMLQDVWRKAWEQEDGLTINFKSKAGAVRARMQLYNAVKAQKTGKDLSDPELVRAAEQLEIVWLDEQTIKLQRRDKSDMLQGIMAVLGKDVHSYIDPEILASQERMLKQLDGLREGGLATEHKDTPFWKARET